MPQDRYLQSLMSYRNGLFLWLLMSVLSFGVALLSYVGSLKPKELLSGVSGGFIYGGGRKESLRLNILEARKERESHNCVCEAPTALREDGDCKMMHWNEEVGAMICL